MFDTRHLDDASSLISITATDNNGYRLQLQRDLSGSKLLYVGSTSGGTMDDNWHEGWNGFTIDQISGKVALSQSYLQPNIVLLHAGTNDLNMNPAIDPDHAPDRLGALIDKILSFGADGTLVLVAQIINAQNAQTQSLIDKYNAAIPGVVAQRVASNHRVAVVDFRNRLQPSDYFDGLHPNDGGYRKMGDVWFKAIQDAADKGWISPPRGPTPELGNKGGGSNPKRSACLTPPIWVPALNSNGGPIATGVGHNGDMKWTANYGPHWTNAFEGINKNGSDVMFADLNGDGRADYLHVNRTTGAVLLYLNTGSGDEVKFEEANGGKEIATGLGPRELIRFADIDLDGKDDYIVIGNDTGSVTVWINGGATSDGWGWNGPHEVAPGALPPGTKGIDVMFADINGDGRPDYIVKDSKGGLDAYLNIGKPKTIAGIEWKPAGHIASGTGTADISLSDINGDGRADYLTWSDVGALTGYLNYRTEKEGSPGWAPTGDAKSVAGGVGRSSTWCRLADLNADGKADYIVLGDKGEVEVYINKGTADTSVIGDGIRLADLNGDGFDDYLFLEPNGAVHMYVNGGQSSDGQKWSWIPFKDFAEIANGAGAKREEVLFADMDGRFLDSAYDSNSSGWLTFRAGDGKDDFVIVNPKTGGLTLYKSGGQQPDGNWGWVPAGEIASGLGGPGKAVRLADMNGDRKADYIQLGDNGETKIYINGGPQGNGGWNWAPYNDFKNIAEGIGFTRDHVQFKDIDGDGLADYIGVDQMDGHTVVYRNLGPQPEGHWGWFGWNDGKPIGKCLAVLFLVAFQMLMLLAASGIGSVGADVIFGRMEKTARYSYLGVAPNSGALRAYLNGCNQNAPSADPGSGPGTGSGGSAGGGTGTGSGGSGSGSGGNSGTGSGSGNAGSGSGSSGSGSGGNGGSGNGSGNNGGSNDNNNNGGYYIEGGLPIPDGGLGGLNLPTQGLPALAALVPYAISAENALTTAQQAVNNLKSGKPTAAGVAAAEAAVQQAAQALNAVSAQANSIDMSSFDPVTASQIQQDQKALQDAAKAVSDTIPCLQECANKPDDCSQVYDEVANTLSAPSTTGPAASFGSKGSGQQAGSGGSGGSGSSGSGSGDSGSGGGSGGAGGCHKFTPLGGGLPFPSGGLGGLGLATAGTAALTALKPYGIAAQNAIGAASSLLSCLGDSPSGAQLSAAADSLSSAASDVGALASQMDAIELSSFSGDAVSAVQTEITALRGASSLLGKGVTQLRNCLASNSCRTVIGGVLATTVATEVANPIYWFYGSSNNPAQTGKPPPPSLGNSTDSDEPLPWLLNTRKGTSLEAFKSFILTLPDKGGGRQMVYETLPQQWYATRMTLIEAKIVHQFPIVDQMVPNTPIIDWELCNTGLPKVHPLRPRDGPSIVTASNRSPWYLRWLSTPQDKPIRSGTESEYIYEQSAGQGSFVYVLDTAVDWDHEELKNIPHELYVASFLRKPGEPSDSYNHLANVMDGYGHGTQMVGAIAGNEDGYGVAPKATIVSVIIGRGREAKDPLVPEYLAETWAWAINDVNMKGRNGKAAISMASSFPYRSLLRQDPNRGDPRYQRWALRQPTEDDVFLPLLANAWDADIATVIPAGNDKRNRNGDRSPQRLANTQNPLIVAGALQEDGERWDNPTSNLGTSLPGPSRDGIDPSLQGSLEIWSIAADIPCALPDDTHLTYTGGCSGTSFATSLVAGLLAYWNGLPAPYTLPAPNRGTQSYRSKQLLIATKRSTARRSPDCLNQVYNQISALIRACNSGNQPRSLEEAITSSSSNETASALLWSEVERRWWEEKRLEDPTFGDDFEDFPEHLKEAMGRKRWEALHAAGKGGY
ncbi:MAG: hypothetical protein Q9219_003169 [cf. Caloplaca sp. 3 TL-2023]